MTDANETPTIEDVADTPAPATENTGEETNALTTREDTNGANTTANTPMESDQQSRPKPDKAEPLNILVRDQTGAGLQFKVRKNTKFEKVMTAFCQKKSYQMSQVRFLYDGERIQKDQTPQSVEMEEGDVIDCVIEQLGGHVSFTFHLLHGI